MLLQRISRLERIMNQRVSSEIQSEMGPVETEEMIECVRSSLSILDYRTWRHEGLSLEQLLALARDDGRYAQAHPHEPHFGSLYEDVGPNAAGRAAHACREFEIRILERDRRIDIETARALRVNAANVFRSLGAQDWQEGLRPLPTVIEFDEPIALVEARSRCPRRSSLPIERQVEMEHEDHAHEVRQRATRQRPSRAGSLDHSFDAVRDRIHQLRIAELEAMLTTSTERTK